METVAGGSADSTGELLTRYAQLTVSKEADGGFAATASTVVELLVSMVETYLKQ